MKRTTTSEDSFKIWKFTIPKFGNQYAVPNILKTDKFPSTGTAAQRKHVENVFTNVDSGVYVVSSTDVDRGSTIDNTNALYVDMKEGKRGTDEYCHVPNEGLQLEEASIGLVVKKTDDINIIDYQRLKAGPGQSCDHSSACVKLNVDGVTHRNTTSKAFPEIVFSFFSTRDRKNVCKRRLSDYSSRYENKVDIEDYLCPISQVVSKKPSKMELHYASSPMLLSCDTKVCLKSKDFLKSEIKVYVNSAESDKFSMYSEIEYDQPKIFNNKDMCNYKNNIYNEVLYNAESTSSDDLIKINNPEGKSNADNTPCCEEVKPADVCSLQDLKSISRAHTISVCNNSLESIAVLDYFIEKPVDEYDDKHIRTNTNIAIHPRCRRATLLRNEMIPFYTVKKKLRGKKVRINRAWRDIKGWLDIEKVKINKIIKKHAAKQRLNSFENNSANSSECTQTDDENSQRECEEYLNLPLSRSRSRFSECSCSSPKLLNAEIYLDSEIEHKSDFSSQTILCNHKRSSLDIGKPIFLKVNSEEVGISNNADSKVDSCHNSIDSYSSLTYDSFDGQNSIKNSLLSDFNSESGNECIVSNIRKKGTNVLTSNYVFGLNGFEELRRYVKQGGDFCKELSTILQERSEAEVQYAKSLSKLGSKLSKICRVNVGSCTEAWRHISQEMEQQAEIHRQYSGSLTENIVKPLKQMTDSQHKMRKQVENDVDKASRCLTEWRTAEAKSKKQSHTAARENEKLQDPASELRMIRSPSLAHISRSNIRSTIRPERHSTVAPPAPTPSNGHDKEVSKSELKKRKAEDAVKKADEEYYTLCVRAERTRLDWESTILNGGSVMEHLEEERLQSLKTTAEDYLKISASLAPQSAECIQRLTGPIAKADPLSDIKAVRGVRGNPTAGTCEQLLPDFYCEHITLAMNRERRTQALMTILELIKTDIDKERKSKQGLEKLSLAIKEHPNFGTDDSQMNVADKMFQMRSMLTYLEAARYKIKSALCELENKPKGQHPLAAHIQVTRDKQGLQQSLLKIPSWLQTDYLTEKGSPPASELAAIKRPSLASQKLFSKKSSKLRTPPLPPDSPLNWTDRGDGDGVSNQPDSDFDEFSSQDGSCEDITDATNSIIASPAVISMKDTMTTPELEKKPIGKCKAIYPYTPNLYDELKLTPGDIITIFGKQEDGWWSGDHNGTVGIFPACYVEEFM